MPILSTVLDAVQNSEYYAAVYDNNTSFVMVIINYGEARVLVGNSSTRTVNTDDRMPFGVTKKLNGLRLTYPWIPQSTEVMWMSVEQWSKWDLLMDYLTGQL